MSDMKDIPYHFIDLTDLYLPPAALKDHRTASLNKALIEKLIAKQPKIGYGAIIENTAAKFNSPQPSAPLHPAPLAGTLQAAQSPSMPSDSAESAQARSTADASDEPALPGKTEDERDSQGETEESEAPAQPVQEAAAGSVSNSAQKQEQHGPAAPSHEPSPAIAERETPLADTAPNEASNSDMLPDDQTTSTPDTTEHMLHDVQATLENLAGMARGLAQQKLEAGKQQDTLEARKLQLQEKERQLGNKEEQLKQLQNQLLLDKSAVDQFAENNARLLAERSAALQQLAESVEARERSSIKRAEVQQLEQQRNEELAEQLRMRLAEVEKRETSLQSKNLELAEKLKQLVSAKERFGSIVKSFNETMQFNNGLHAISKTVLGEED
ncbi:hypothetical protein D9M68_620440 [compost metagenome]